MNAGHNSHVATCRTICAGMLRLRGLGAAGVASDGSSFSRENSGIISITVENLQIIVNHLFVMANSL